MQSIPLIHFSDLLCIWAYIAQIRIDELSKNYGEQVQIDYRFCSVFGNVPAKIEKNWQHKGGDTAFHNHLLHVAEKFPHVEVHPDVWIKDPPQSSLSCHLFLSAVKQMELDGEPTGRVSYSEFTWAMREAFFKHAINISRWDNQVTVAEEHDIKIDSIYQKINSGRAFIRLASDIELARKYGVHTSPALIFNEGRQRLFGNVGYRVIEANIRELLNKSQDEEDMSWC